MENTLHEEIENNIITILEDNGFIGIDLLNELKRIYNVYSDKHIKEWVLNREDIFIRLKDTVWYNFEHKINDSNMGVSSLKYLGTRFPNFIYLFDSEDTLAYLYLPKLLEELNEIIELWENEKELYVAELYADEGIALHGGEQPTNIIIHLHNQHPKKYAKDCVDTVSVILDNKGNRLKTKKKLYGYCSLNGPINNFEQSSIYLSLLKDLKNTVNIAIQYHKDLKLVIKDEYIN